MPKSPLRSTTLAAFLALTVTLHAGAQTNAPSTNAPAATAPAPIAAANIVTSAQDDLTKLQADQSEINPDATAEAVRASLAEITRAIDKRLDIDRHFTQANPSLSTLQNAQTAWQDILTSLDGKGGLQEQLSSRVNAQHELLSTLMTMSATWKATLDTEKGNNALLQSIQQVQTQITATTNALNTGLKDLYALQVATAHQSARVKEALASVNKSIAAAQARLLEQNQPALWSAAAFSGEGSDMGRERASLSGQFAYLQAYLVTKGGAVLIHALLLVILIATFFWIRNAVRARVQSDSSLREAERIFGAPLSTALLLALVASNWLYPQAESPRLLWSIIGAVALVPTFILIRRLVATQVMPLLYAMVAAYIVGQVRNVLTPDGVAARFLLLGEMIALCLFILVVLHTKRLSSAEAGDSVEKILRGYLHAAFFIFLAAAVASFLGYEQMSLQISNGALSSSYLAVSFYAGVRILDALVLVLLTLRPFRTSGMVRNHHDLVYAKTAAIIRWIATAVWAVLALQFFGLRNPLWQQTENFLAFKPLPLGTFRDLQVGAILAFPLTVWAAFAISRLVRFALEEDVYPNLHLPRGIPYAISSVVHYTLLVIGFFLALNAVGIDLSNYAVLAGAFGVGLGFGLQNIMNNFISGLILLFERPVKVGDTIQIDPATIGKVERIGIRASVILLTNGSELIVPNGNLISNPVTNWTLSNCERLIEIPVNIAPKTNTQRALEILVAAAKANSAVLKNPPPNAIVIGIAAAATSLKLRCWIDSEESDWARVTTDLSLAVQTALEKENIPLA